MLVPSLQSRPRWPRASPEDGGLSPSLTLFLHRHHPPLHHLFQQPHLCQLTWNLQLSFPGAADEAAHPPLYFVANFEPKCRTFPSVHITQHLLDLTLRSAGGRGVSGVPPGSVCGSGWLVFEVLLSSRAGRPGREQSPVVHCCRLPPRPGSSQDGSSWAPWSSQPDGCPLSEAPVCRPWGRWVSDLSPALCLLPLPLSLSLVLYPLPLCQSSCSCPLPPLPLPSSSTFSLMLMAKVMATRIPPTSTKRVLGSVLGRGRCPDLQVGWEQEGTEEIRETSAA